MYERYAESARRAIFYAAAEARAGSPYIEPEHLLLGVMRAAEPELSSLLELNRLEQEFRAGRAALEQATAGAASIPLANATKRILAYGAEEATRLNSWVINCGHLLLGIVRASDGVAARFLVEHGISLEKARQAIATLPQPETSDAAHRSGSKIAWVSKLRRRLWISSVVQLALLVLLGWALASSALGGVALLIVAAVWIAAVAGWLFRRGSISFVFRHRDRRRAIALAFAFSTLYQLFVYGWIVALAVGIYRLVRQ